MKKTLAIATLLLFCSVSLLAQNPAKPAPKPKQVAKAAEPEIVDMTPPKKPAGPGPFGFEAGMTKEALIAKLGSKSVMSVEGDLIVFNTAPSPHMDFERYVVMFSPSGLVLVLAYTRPIESNSFGEQIKDKYRDIFTTLRVKYGITPTAEIDSLDAGSSWHEPQYWMMGLVKKERKLEAMWDKKTMKTSFMLPAHLSTVLLSAEATSTGTGIISISYAFDGYDEYQKDRKYKQDSVF